MGGKARRSSSGVAPMMGGDDDYVRQAKHEQNRGPPPPPLSPSSSGRRIAPARGWLMLFVLVNLFAIATFTFFSAVYFPSASTSGIIKHINKQGDVALLELPRRVEKETQRPHGEEETAAPANDGAAPIVTDAAGEKKPHLRSESDPDMEEEDGITAAVGDPDIHDPTEVVETTSKIHPDTFPMETTAATLDETPAPATSATRTLPAEDIGQLMREMKATPLPTAESPPVTTVVTKGLEEPRDGVELPSHGEEGFEAHLVLWLKADEGVEVEDPTECEALGSACDLKAWKSVVTDRIQHPIAFKPVSPAMRPLLQPLAHNKLPLVSFSCGMAHTSGIVVHDMRTLFFVLSPSRIEPGDTYRAQKFFGNSPYGQFLFHGGKPAFFTAGGLRESDFVASNNELVLIAYRLHRNSAEIKTNGQHWSPQSTQDDNFPIRMSGNAALSLGNVKAACDTNSFQGQVAEVLIYDAVLSNERVRDVELYLLSKWWGENAPTPVLIEPTPVSATQAAVKETEVPPEAATQLVVENPATSEDTLDQNGEEGAREDVQPTPLASEPQIDNVVNPPAQTEVARKDVDGVHGEGEIPDQGNADEEIQNDDPEAEYPRTFDPEGVFEWLPPADLLTAISKHKGIDTTALVSQWKEAVREKVDTVRNFQLGGEVLRSFIRERRDELLTLRQELFG